MVRTSFDQRALDYIQSNEEPLAFEILCDHISEYKVAITPEEYERIYTGYDNV
ncbi:MAG: MafI family immunity protein [Pantoea sp.]|uniref:MafI family immunity protein n=1 Tax=Pantoea sp. TaxID=69393 RepID=UPI002914CA59|nr:MafI family immunity protein [Pantoea sp.]MDU7839456.1 MafI family immunity protein [Pantoea sp.]